MGVDNVNLAYSLSSLGKYFDTGPLMYTMGSYYEENNSGVNVFLPTPVFKVNEWVHLTSTLSGNTGTIYINGKLAGRNAVPAPLNKTRKSNFIGKTNWHYYNSALAVFDDLKIFNRALSDEEVITNMNIYDSECCSNRC